jgi:hypothetical protein
MLVIASVMPATLTGGQTGQDQIELAGQHGPQVGRGADPGQPPGERGG